MPVLYLIPTPIAENALATLPAYTVEIARRLDVFVVERAKTARHFIKSLTPIKPLQDMEFVEIGEKDHDAALACFDSAIKEGRDVGLLSEAGCPGVADPGAVLVAHAHSTGVRVQPLVGPSSILLALMASGMNGQRFTFHGYLSPKRLELAKDLRRLEQLAKSQDQTQLFIETPYRSRMVLEIALECLQAQTRFGIAMDVSGEQEMIKVMRIAAWKKTVITLPDKLPAVFMVG